MTYEQIKNSVPEGIQKKTRKIRPIGPKQVLLFFLLQMILFAIFGSLIQYALGMLGVLITELFFLLFSLLYIYWRGHRFRDVFPIKKPKLSALGGTILLWIGAYLLLIVAELVIMVVFPDLGTNSDSEFIRSSGLGWIFTFFVVAIVPPICEEAMHRGVIQYGFRDKIKNPWAMAWIIGLIFGIYHMDPTKFVATGILGGMMGWIMYQTGNMVYSSFLHFIHNGSQVFLLMISPGLVSVKGLSATAAIKEKLFFLTDVDPGFSNSYDLLVGSGILIIFLGILIPFILYLGNWLLIKDLAPRRQYLIPKDKQIVKKLLIKIFTTIAIIISIGALMILIFLLNIL